MVTLEEVKEYLNIVSTNTEYDVFLNRWITRCTKMIEEYCQQRFTLITINQELQNGTGKTFIYVREIPIKTVGLIEETYNYVDWAPFSGIIIPAYDKIYSNRLFRRGDLNYRISYTAGMNSTEVPETVKKVCVEMVAWVYKQGPRYNLLGTRSENEGLTGGGSFSRVFEDMWEKFKKELTPFRIERIK